LKVVVESIPAAGRQVSFDRSVEWAASAATTSLDHAPTRLAGSFQLKRAKTGVVVVDLRASAEAPTTCDRCGEECVLAVEVDTRLLYAPEESGGADYDGLSLDGTRGEQPASTEGIELEERDLDVGWYRNGEVVLSDVLCEALALATPPRIVCADTAECDRRTDALLAATQVATGGPFAALGALKRPAGRG
jgi:uncharacterized metal-binding protein YceD (DUF177 family)